MPSTATPTAQAHLILPGIPRVTDAIFREAGGRAHPVIRTRKALDFLGFPIQILDIVSLIAHPYLACLSREIQREQNRGFYVPHSHHSPNSRAVASGFVEECIRAQEMQNRSFSCSRARSPPDCCLCPWHADLACAVCPRQTPWAWFRGPPDRSSMCKCIGLKAS